VVLSISVDTPTLAFKAVFHAKW